MPRVTAGSQGISLYLLKKNGQRVLVMEGHMCDAPDADSSTSLHIAVRSVTRFLQHHTEEVAGNFRLQSAKGGRFCTARVPLSSLRSMAEDEHYGR